MSLVETQALLKVCCYTDALDFYWKGREVVVFKNKSCDSFCYC